MKYKNKRYKLSVYKAKNVIGLGLWFGYKFLDVGYSAIFIGEEVIATRRYSRIFSFYFPFFVFAFCVHTDILDRTR